ncbi:MAG: alpha-ketoglutarate-dependent dioxygenase AlkB [Planctomycetia bacterium]|nr:alpha-ketoglutarate-dependent dioxygenase AlkB [Planctomycetia bacterium]
MPQSAPLAAPTDASTIPGLSYQTDYLGLEAEKHLLSIIDDQPWLDDLRRRVQHYGYRYDYKARQVAADMYLGPLPDWAAQLASRLHREGWFERVPDQLIVNEYQPGQGISKHVDCVPCFGPTVASLSLGSGCAMEFENKQAGLKVALPLAPRSLVVLQREARYHWTHVVPARKKDHVGGKTAIRGRRVSLTFRTVQLEPVA